MVEYVAYAVVLLAYKPVVWLSHGSALEDMV